MKIINGINPLASGIDWLGVPDLAEFWKDHAPANAEQGGQRCVWLSRADCSVFDEMIVKRFERFELKVPGTLIHRQTCDALLASFCPVKTVKHLVEKVKLPRDFAGVIATDHEIPAWMSCLHYVVYDNLYMAIQSVLPRAAVCEYAGGRADWVMGWNKEDRSHELAAMDAVTCAPVLTPMMSRYVPGWEYIKDRERFKAMVDRNIERVGDAAYFAISPFIEKTQKVEGDYTSGDVVPVDVMRIILQAIADAGAAAVLWGAAKDDEQAGRLLRAVQESVVKAAEGVK